MKYYVFRLTFLLLVVFMSCSPYKQEEAKLPIVTQSVSLGGLITCDTTEYVFVRSTLTNNSEDTLSCISMTCSGDDAYTIESRYLSIDKNICFSNVPMLIKVAPQKSFDYFLRLVTNQKNISLREVNFRLGYNLVLRDTTKEFASQIEQIADMKNIIWSDTVHLKDFWMRYDTE